LFVEVCSGGRGEVERKRTGTSTAELFLCRIPGLDGVAEENYCKEGRRGEKKRGRKKKRTRRKGEERRKKKVKKK